MRLGAWLGAGVLLLSLGNACSGSYPIEPTVCDDWCGVSHGGPSSCDSYEPAGCVTECEAAFMAEPCQPLLEAATECYRGTPSARKEQCSYSPYDPNPMRPCQAEVEALALCSSFTYCPPGFVCG
jgi:hypothetical protein